MYISYDLSSTLYIHMLKTLMNSKIELEYSLNEKDQRDWNEILGRLMSDCSNAIAREREEPKQPKLPPLPPALPPAKEDIVF